MTGLPLYLPPLHDRRFWPIWAARLRERCRSAYRDQSALADLAVQHPNVEDELTHLMSNDSPFPLYDGMWRSLSSYVKDGLTAYAGITGINFPPRTHPKELYALIKTFFCPSPSQIDMLSNLDTLPISGFQSRRHFASYAKLVKIAANKDSTTENERLAQRLERAVEKEDPMLVPMENFVSWTVHWDRLIANLEQ
ncbi:hypothetical protein CcaCcLH18_05678 [Colletotrichum camelliae]|nr:hypothetical protein CcaCcLH18_05678 [Colletotrichum camelliae]